MRSIELAHLHPTLEMLAEELNRAGLTCRVERDAGERRFKDARRYTGQPSLSEDIVYVVGAEEAPRFPWKGFACVSAVPLEGAGGCILCLNRTPEALLDGLLEVFGRCRDMEDALDALVYRRGDLTQLCELGAALLENPICIHDEWFVIIARSRELNAVMAPDYVMSSSREFIPRAIVEDFKNDGDYLETYVHRTARLWSPGPGEPRCVYANLWEGDVYRGRLLVAEYHRAFRKLDYPLAELLAQRALILMRGNQPGLDKEYRSMDDIVFGLLEGKPTEVQEENLFLSMLGWSRGDRLLCVRLEAQRQGYGSVLEHALHSDLFQAFPQSYILFAGRQQCLLLNLSREQTSPQMLRYRLAPLCRDYCLYAGLSSPVAGLKELPAAYLQARLALEKAFRLQSERWIVHFSDCAMEYLLGLVQGPMAVRHLVAPELLRLLRHDREKGTQYYETLRAYLLQERDVPRTSEALIIHRTTLLYRLRKLEALTPMNLDDPEVRLRLLLSLWILEKGEKA